VLRIEVSDDRRTAESPLAIEAHEIPDLVVKLAKAKQHSMVMANLNRLMQHPTDQELGWRAVRHLGFMEESKYPWDYYKILTTIPGERAFGPSDPACPLVSRGSEHAGPS